MNRTGSEETITMPRTFVFLGALNGLLSVALGAFGAHALKARLSADLATVYATASEYQAIHSLGLLAVGRLPYGSFGKSDIGYDKRFSAEEFGLVVGCRERDVAEVDALLRAHQAKEVNLVEG